MKRRSMIWFIAGVVVLALVVREEQQYGRLLRAASPLLSYVYRVSNGARQLARISRDLPRLPKENDDLNNRVSDLLVENARLAEVEHENTLLHAELKVSSDRPSRRLIEARVVGHSPFSFLDTISIDRGVKDGILPNQPVTLHGSLVGKIVSSAHQTAEVQLITSSDAITQSQLQQSRINGVVKGGVKGLELQFIPQDVSITPGENVITSGLSNGIPAGLLIGTVLSVTSKKSDIFQSVAIKPATNMNTIDMVFVEVQ